MIEIVRVATGTLPDLAALRASARAEGFDHIERLATEWASGQQRFSLPGECLYLALEQGTAVSVGGLTRDPAVTDAFRFRRFYTIPDFRGQGLASAITRQILAASPSLNLTVHPGTPQAETFWSKHGFHPWQNDLWRFPRTP